MAINLSARQFRNPALSESFGEFIRTVGMDPATIELEITENVVVDGEMFTKDTLNKLKI